MRILQLLSTQFLTGPAELCLEDGERLRAQGHEVVFGADTRRNGDFLRAIEARGFEVAEELTLCARPTFGEVAFDIARLRQRLRSTDLVHCRFAHDHMLVGLASIGLRNRPALVRTTEILRSLGSGAIRSALLRMTDALIVSCEEYRTRLIEGAGTLPARVHCLPGRVHADRFSPGDGTALRTELGVAPDEVLFGIVSRIKVERRHALLVRAFAQLAARHPQVRLAIIGRGEFRPELEALIDSTGMRHRIQFTGYRADEALVEAYRALDVKVWLTEGNDGTCRAVLEAMGCGKPVIGGASGATASLIRPEVDGLLTRLELDSVIEALEKMIDPERRARMGTNARQRALEFTPERRARGLWEIYEMALAHRREEPQGQGAVPEAPTGGSSGPFGTGSEG